MKQNGIVIEHVPRGDLHLTIIKEIDQSMGQHILTEIESVSVKGPCDQSTSPIQNI